MNALFGVHIMGLTIINWLAIVALLVVGIILKKYNENIDIHTPQFPRFIIALLVFLVLLVLSFLGY